MYIKSDYKEQYLEYIRQAGYSANTVRNIKSDINSLFIWLQAYQYQIAHNTLYDAYQRYLVLSGAPLHTMTRKLSTISKFILWINARNPTHSVHSESDAQIAHQNNLKYQREPTVFHRNSTLKFLQYSGIIVLTMSLIIGILLFRVVFPFHSPKNAIISNLNTPSTDYIIQFDLLLHSDNSLPEGSISTIMFKFYLQNDPSHSIGYVECPLSISSPTGGSSRLKVKLDSHCSPLPATVHDAIARNEAILADILLDGKKFTSSKVALLNQKPSKSELTYQEDVDSATRKAGTIDNILPSVLDRPNILGSATASSSATTFESIPLSLFQDVQPIDDGDLVTIYNDTLTRALLSTKILGIKSSDLIITQGVAYVHIVDSPDILINVGDYISTSTTPGYGQKAASKYDSIVGVALEPYTSGNSFLKVLIAVH